MNTEFIKGVIVPILTPIDKDEVMDEGKMRKQVDFVIDGGVSGILAFGSNGEFYMAEEDEMIWALNIMLDQSSGRGNQHQEMHPHCKSRSLSRRRRHIGSPAHVSETHRGRAVPAFQTYCGCSAGYPHVII